MIKKLTLQVLIGLLLFLNLPACASRKRVIVHPAGARVVVIKKGHIHSARCGHYHYRGKWYFIKGHTHRRGCGHIYSGGV